MKKIKIKQTDIHLVKLQQDNCNSCAGLLECICANLEPEIHQQAKSLVSQSGPYLEGDYLVHRGDKFRSYLLVKNGVIRSETVSYNGRNKVKCFYFPGDLIGMEAMSEGVWPADLIVTRTTMLCEISVSNLERMVQKHPEIQTRLLKRFGSRILDQEYSLASDYSEASMTRVLEYLLQLFDRLEDTEYVTDSWIQLPMNKNILASYLGISAETLSRILAKLEKQNIIVNQPQAIKINDRDKIRQIL